MSKAYAIAIAAILLIGGSSLSFAQSSLPPAKRAIEDRYRRERAAAEQNPAPKNPNIRYSAVPLAPTETGIGKDCSPPLSSEEASIASCWRGIVNGVETAVYTGAEGSSLDPMQGVVYMVTLPVYPAEPSLVRLMTPIRGGVVSIVAAQNNVLTLVSATGSYTLTFDVRRREFTSVIVDKTPPAISGMPTSACILWPPNDKMVQVAMVTASDSQSGLDPGTFRVTGASSEPSDPSNPDIVIEPNGSGEFIVKLRAERLRMGKGRIYTLTAKATDWAGNTAASTAVCTVPRDQAVSKGPESSRSTGGR